MLGVRLMRALGESNGVELQKRACRRIKSTRAMDESVKFMVGILFMACADFSSKVYISYHTIHHSSSIYIVAYDHI